MLKTASIYSGWPWQHDSVGGYSHGQKREDVQEMCRALNVERIMEQKPFRSAGNWEGRFEIELEQKLQT